jgi:hypothetical protein
MFFAICSSNPLVETTDGRNFIFSSIKFFFFYFLVSYKWQMTLRIKRMGIVEVSAVVALSFVLVIIFSSLL